MSDERSNLKAYILCRFARDSGLYNTWMDQASIPCEVVDDYAPDWPLPQDAGIVITHMHYRWEEIHALRRWYEKRRVPILILCDGILEYRNTWEHPDLADGSIFQPAFGHKLACLGRGQARVLETWGNVGKCEVVGLPRLDHVLGQPVKPVQKTGPFRVLIATANTPAFNEEQRLSVIESLGHIRQRLQKNSRVNGRPVQAIWRLTDGLEHEIGLEPSDIPDPEAPRRPLLEVIDDVDAVITTPSTLFLEAALKKRPTALLDFYNAPHYVPAAWMINAPKHLNWILSELADPPAPKMLFQETVLHDQLECYTPALPRMLELIDAMVQYGAAARRKGNPLRLPARILEDEMLGFSRVPPEFDLSRLYPDNPVFKNQEVVHLQLELEQAIQRLGTLPRELAEKNQHLIRLSGQRDALQAQNADLRLRIHRLRKLLGIKRPGTAGDDSD